MIPQVNADLPQIPINLEPVDPPPVQPVGQGEDQQPHPRRGVTQAMMKELIKRFRRKGDLFKYMHDILHVYLPR